MVSKVASNSEVPSMEPLPPQCNKHKNKIPRPTASASPTKKPRSIKPLSKTTLSSSERTLPRSDQIPLPRRNTVAELHSITPEEFRNALFEKKEFSKLEELLSKLQFKTSKAKIFFLQLSHLLFHSKKRTAEIGGRFSELLREREGEEAITELQIFVYQENKESHKGKLHRALSKIPLNIRSNIAFLYALCSSDSDLERALVPLIYNQIKDDRSIFLFFVQQLTELCRDKFPTINWKSDYLLTRFLSHACNQDPDMNKYWGLIKTQIDSLIAQHLPTHLKAECLLAIYQIPLPNLVKNVLRIRKNVVAQIAVENHEFKLEKQVEVLSEFLFLRFICPRLTLETSEKSSIYRQLSIFFQKIVSNSHSGMNRDEACRIQELYSYHHVPFILGDR